MDADLPDLRRFAQVPYAIEAPASLGLGAAAAAAAGARTIGVTLDPRGLDMVRYRGLLDRLRGEIGGLRTTAYRISVLDRTAPDLEAEGRGVDRSLAALPEILAAQGKPTAFAGTYRGRQGIGCAIAGFPPGYDHAARLSGPVGRPIPLRGIDPEGFHWFALRHELGHCLLGASEARADAFAALMGLRDGSLDRGRLAVLAAYREAEEWLSPDPDDDHFSSASLWGIVRRTEALAADPRIKAMGVERVAELARDAADRLGLDRRAVEEAKAVRRGALAARALHPAGPEGLGGFVAWARSHPGVPALARLAAAMENLAAGAGPMPPFAPDAMALRAALAGLAHSGDRTAAAMLRGMSAPRVPKGARPEFAQSIPLARGYAPFDVAGLPVSEGVAAPGPR